MQKLSENYWIIKVLQYSHSFGATTSLWQLGILKQSKLQIVDHESETLIFFNSLSGIDGRGSVYPARNYAGKKWSMFDMIRELHDQFGINIHDYADYDYPTAQQPGG